MSAAARSAVVRTCAAAAGVVTRIAVAVIRPMVVKVARLLTRPVSTLLDHYAASRAGAF